LLPGVVLTLPYRAQVGDAAGLLTFSRAFPEKVAGSYKRSIVTLGPCCADPLIPSGLPFFNELVRSGVIRQRLSLELSSKQKTDKTQRTKI
jgi:hypothetical protein